MKNILYIGQSTLKAYFRDKLFIYTLISVFLLVPVCIVAFQFSLGSPEKITLDISLGLSSFSVCLISMFLGANAITSERSSKAIYVVLSKSVKRYEYLMGKFLGIATFNLFNVLVLNLTLFLMYMTFDIPFRIDYLMGFVFTFCESLILIGVSIFFSLIANIYIALLMSFSVFLFGNNIEILSNEFILKSVGGLRYLIDLIKYICPNFTNLSIKQYLIFDQALDFQYYVMGLGYTLFYCVIILAISIVVFERVELE